MHGRVVGSLNLGSIETANRDETVEREKAGRVYRTGQLDSARVFDNKTRGRV